MLRFARFRAKTSTQLPNSHMLYPWGFVVLAEAVEQEKLSILWERMTGRSSLLREGND
jgi:hypothetical protein